MRVELRTHLDKKKQGPTDLKKALGKKVKKRQRTDATHAKENVNPKRKPTPEEKAMRAQEMLDEFGLCPISMQPMRRPVLPASGQAFDEISIVRYCKQGKKKCPVSGTDFKFEKKKAKLMFTTDYCLRKFITTQAANANVFVPSTDKESLMREVQDSYRPEAAKAVVDDCYLGYIKLDELRALLEKLAESDTSESDGHDLSTYQKTCRTIVAECLACREPKLCSLAVEYLDAESDLWKDKEVLQEALAVGQDPDCRGEVLNVLEGKIEERDYSMTEMKTILAFESENVPIQQFQCNTAETFLAHCTRTICKETDKSFIPVINQALRVREDLEGVSSSGAGIDEVWHQALQGLKKYGGSLDEACLQRLFWRENCMVLQNLAQCHQELLMWHLKQHEGALSLCIQTIASCPFPAPGMGDEMYTSDEDDYYSENGEEAGGIFTQGYGAEFEGQYGSLGARIVTASRSRGTHAH